MPPKSRKKIKGRAKREAKAAKKVTEANGQERAALGLQFQQLQLNHSAWDGRKELNNDEKCLHGCDWNCVELEAIESFLNAWCENESDVIHNYYAARIATMNKFEAVWEDESKMEAFVSLFLSVATNLVLDGEGDKEKAFVYAMHARYFEEWMAQEIYKTKASIQWPKLIELGAAVEQHTLISFLKKRIPCSCLDAKHAAVKCQPKMGICANPRCSLPGYKGGQLDENLTHRTVEKSTMKYCTRCKQVCYCSRNCQVIDVSRSLYCSCYLFAQIILITRFSLVA
jgi:hypothetical protein